MAMVDKFILLKSVQFEKGGYQNRFMYKGKWATKAVKHGLDKIKDKEYVGLEGKNTYNDSSLAALNEDWIRTLAKTFNIKTQILDDDLYAPHPDDPTLKLIDIIQGHMRNYDSDIIYVTNEEAKDKYLDEDKMKAAGIQIEYCKVPKHLQLHTFEVMETHGIESITKQLAKLCKV